MSMDRKYRMTSVKETIAWSDRFWLFWMPLMVLLIAIVVAIVLVRRG